MEWTVRRNTEPPTIGALGVRGGWSVYGACGRNRWQTSVLVTDYDPETSKREGDRSSTGGKRKFRRLA
jgi:hypothetical protein